MTRRVVVKKSEDAANGEIKRRESKGWELVDQEICRRVVHEHDVQFDDDYYVMMVFEKDEEGEE